MSDLNRWAGTGNLGADSEQRFTQGGSCMLKFRIASTDVYMKDGEKKESTEWTDCILWGTRAEKLSGHLTKGTRVYVEGAKRTRSYEGKDGQKRYATEINVRELIFMGGGKGGGGQRGPRRDEPTGFGGGEPDSFDDDIPF